MKIGYIVHDLNDPSVERRCVMLERGGAEVVLAGFYRGQFLKASAETRNAYIMGQSKDAAFVNRVFSTFRQTAFNSRLRNLFADCDVLVARNLEQLAIASRLSKSRPLIYECLDLHRLLLESSKAAKLVQSIESKVLTKVDGLLTSSAAFLRHHFDHTTLNAPTHLIENKLLVPSTPNTLPDPMPAGPVLRIGWFGMLRCKKTFEFLKRLAARSNGRIEVMISGKPSSAELPDLPSQAEAAEGVEYTGPYTYKDLSELYGRCHLAWAIDWFEEGLNSEWLLPNRLYESIAHGTVPIVKDNTEMSRWLAARNAGLRISLDVDPELSLLNLDADSLKKLQGDLMSVPVGDVYADNQDCERLVEIISRGKVS